ncbi:hypothetical protein [Erwinia sp. E_sp_B04_7]|uniref:hypothetical protein n=1 Tax=unclassified Erwinia TaxID=2622719 RepID=UPI0030D23CB3
MSTILSLFSDGWHVLAAVGVVLAAVVASWFGGKKIGKVQQKARSDVASAKEEAQRVAVVANKQALDIKEVKNVQDNNNVLTDDAARDKLRDSPYNQQ